MEVQRVDILKARRLGARRKAWLAAGAAAVLALGLVAGCRQQVKQAAAPTDQQLTGAIQTKIQDEQALNGQSIQVSVQNGVATLSGTAANDASRALAGDDAGSVSGVKTVVNNLTVQPAEQASVAPPAPAPEPAPERKDENRHEARHHQHSEAASQFEAASQPQQADVAPSGDGANLAPVTPSAQTAAAAPAPAAAPPVAPAAPPPAPPKPVIRRVTIPAGTLIPVTLTEELNSKTAEANDTFHASVATDVFEHGVVAIPRGTPVLGEVVDAKKAGHFSGQAFLSVELTQMTVRGRKIGVTTDPYRTDGAGGRGKNTAEKTGGGALFGALVGALAGGGKGAAIGALAGGGAGAGVNAVTRGKEAVIPSESRVDFRLQEPITVKVTPGASGNNGSYEPRLVQPQ